MSECRTYVLGAYCSRTTSNRSKRERQLYLQQCCSHIALGSQCLRQEELVVCTADTKKVSPTCHCVSRVPIDRVSFSSFACNFNTHLFVISTTQ